MHDDIHFYEPRNGHGLPHDPLNALVAPRPIGWFSSRSGDGALNLAPYSFFNLFNYRPPIVGFASVGYKDTAHNVLENGEFCWNLVTRPLAEAMNATSAMVAAEVDEFELGGLTAEPSRLVSVPRVAESPVSFECRVSQHLRLQGADGRLVDTWLILGEVVGVHIRRDLLRDGIYDTAAAQPVMRGGGAAAYFAIDADQRFEMPRPG